MSQTATRVVLVCLVLGFATWGLHGAFSPNQNIIAKYKGIDVSKIEYLRAYQQLPKEVKNLNSSEQSKLELQNMLIDTLIKRKILLARLKDYHFSHTNESVTAGLNDLNAKTGDIKLYMQSNHYSESELLEELRDSALFGLLEDGLNNISTTWPSSDSLIKHASSVVKDIKIVPVEISTLKPKNKQLQVYFEANKEKYITPEKAEVLVTKFSTDNFLKNIKFKENDLLMFYNAHVDWYIKPAYLTVDYYYLIPGKLTEKNKILTEQQISELNANSQALGKLTSKRFEENTTDPALYRVLDSIKVGSSDFTQIDGKEVIAVIKDKQNSVTPQFSDIIDQVEHDFKKDKLRKVSDQIRDSFIRISNGDNVSLEPFNRELSTNNLLLDKANWDINKKYTFQELDSGDLLLSKLIKIKPKTYLSFQQAQANVRQDYISQELHSLAKSKAEQIRLKPNEYSGEIYKLSIETKPFLDLDLEKLRAMQFYNNMESLILKSSTGKYYVAFLTGVTTGKNISVPYEILARNDLKNIFTSELTL